jgi:uracil-DNA glycosylase
MAKKKKAATPSLFEEEAKPTAPAEADGPVEYPLPADLPKSWLTALEPETHKPYWNELQKFVAEERATKTIFPPAGDVYNAFRYTPLEKVKVFLLGQDPYPGAGQAHGLSFSVRPGISLPASLRNIYKELESDLGIKPVKHGYLASWAKQGVLLLNACLTVPEGQMNAHANKGWEKFTDAAIKAVNDREKPAVFLLWGAYARKKIKLIDESKHIVIQSAHPSPLSAAAGFFGSKPFSKINEALEKMGEKPIDWQLPAEAKEE